MKMITVRMLKDGEAFTTSLPDSLEQYKKGDVVAFVDHFVPGMLNSKTCELLDAKPAEVVKEDEPLNLKKANLAELTAEAVRLGIDPTTNGKPKTKANLAKEIEEELEGGDDVVLDDLDREALLSLIEETEELKSIEVTDEMDDEAIRDAITAVYDDVAPENKVENPVTETK